MPDNNKPKDIDTTAGDQPKDAASKRVQDATDKANAKGYLGISTDPTPNENYTIQGVTSGKPTPETDPAQAAKVGSSRFSGAFVPELKDEDK